MKKRARVAVIGTGWWATFAHVSGLKNHPDADLVALCDINEQRLHAAATHFEVARTYTDVGEMLRSEELDGAVISVYHTAHYDVARACLDAGLHIMLEKPMVLEAAHGRDLLARARAAGRDIIVGYPWHYTPTARRARDIIQGGELGHVQFVSSLYASMVVELYRGNPAAYQDVLPYIVTGPDPHAYSDVKLAGGGQGYLQVTHSAALMFWVTGLQATRVSAFMENFDLPVDLVDAISVRFSTGAVGVVGSTGNVGIGGREPHDLRVYCSHGDLTLDLDEGTLVVRRYDGAGEFMGPLPPEQRYPHFATSHNLVDVIFGHDVNQSPGEIGLHCVEFLAAAYQSAACQGQPTAIP